MKIIRNIISFILILILAACSLDESPKMNVIEAPQLNSPENTNYVLDESTSSLTAQTFSWSRGQFGFSSAANYVLEASNTSDFINVYKLGSVFSNFLPVTVGALNACALNFEQGSSLDPVKLYLRINCLLNEAKGDNAVSLYSSNIVTIDVTPYMVASADPQIFIIGTPNGWNINDGSVPLTCSTKDDIYVGIVQFKEGDNAFKIYQKLGDWDTNHLGLAVEDIPIDITNGISSGRWNGTLVDGKGNISFSLTQDDKYTITVNLKTLDISIEQGGTDPSTWTYIYVVGTPNGWDINGDGVKLVSKNGDGIYIGTLNLNKDSNMFRFYTALGNWDTNSIGSQESDSPIDITADFDNGIYSGNLVKGKGSFTITAAGKYKVTVDTNKMKLTLERQD